MTYIHEENEPVPFDAPQDPAVTLCRASYHFGKLVNSTRKTKDMATEKEGEKSKGYAVDFSFFSFSMTVLIV